MKVLKHRIFLIFIFLFIVSFSSASEIDSLLHVLDAKISKREQLLKEKLHQINLIKEELRSKKRLEDVYEVQNKLIDMYQSFNCDSSLCYIEKNLNIASSLKNQEWIVQSKIRLSFVLSISGLFAQAKDIFETINYRDLPGHLKALYCWSYIRYNENIIKYSDNSHFEDFHFNEINKIRTNLLGLLGEESDMYLKEKAFTLTMSNQFKASEQIQRNLFLKEEKNTHGYGMAAMGLSRIYKDLGDEESFQKYLIISAITDVELAIKDNESLLTLAIDLHRKGDINRAFTYIKAALDDANYYNSRFRNAVIARIHPIIESTYLAKIQDQSDNLRLYTILLSFIVFVLIVTLYFLYKEKQQVSKSRKILDKTNQELRQVNHILDEANLIRERYIGYYINQCVVYLDEIEDFRKQVLRKLKSGQIQDLIKTINTNVSIDHNTQDLYVDFDRSFLEICPSFVDEFNELLKEAERYHLTRGQLNTELRIFALIRLGVYDVNQIATFLRYSIQTIYNYKSKVKGKALDESSNFEEKVKKIGILFPKIL